MEQLFIQPDTMPFLEVRTTLGSVMPYDAHFHTGFSLGVIVEGQTRFFLDGKPHIARKGDIVLIEPGRVHSCNPINGQPRGYHMFFFDETWFAATALVPGWGSCKLGLARPVITEPDFYAEAVAMAGAVRSGSGTETMFSDFLAAILPHAGAAPLAESSPGVTALKTALFPPADAVAYYTISGLAEKAKMRRESFSRVCRRKTGLPPQSYLHCLRIEKGRWLLRQGKSIAETALETGYTDQSHFHRRRDVYQDCFRNARLLSEKAVTFVQEISHAAP